MSTEDTILITAGELPAHFRATPVIVKRSSGSTEEATISVAGTVRVHLAAQSGSVLVNLQPVASKFVSFSHLFELNPELRKEDSVLCLEEENLSKKDILDAWWQNVLTPPAPLPPSTPAQAPVEEWAWE